MERLGDVDALHGQAVAVLEVVREGLEPGGGAGVAAAVEAVVEAPVPARPTERALLEPPYVVAQESALEHGYAQRPPPLGETGRQPRERAAGATGEGDHVGVPAQLLAERPAAADGRGIAAALRHHDRVLGVRRAQQGRQDLRLGLAAVRGAVHEPQAHAVGRAPGQRGVERPPGQFLTAHHAHRGQPEQPAGGRRGPQVVRVGTAERDDGATGRGGEVRREFAPFVADQIRVDQVVALE